ncbi:hypothetical protein ES703_55229 [subsurface metagenome]
MPARKKTICLSEDEYRKLVQARGKYEHETGEKTTGFGEFIAFVVGLYLLDKFLKERDRQSKK